MTDKTTDKQPQPEPVKWVKLTNEHGNIMEVPPEHVADNEKNGWKVVKE